MDELHLLHSAAMWMGRLDQLLKDPDLRAIVDPWTARSEALAIAASEEMASTNVRIVGIGAHEGHDIYGKADRVAHDIHRAVLDLIARTSSLPTAIDIRATWDTTERTNLRRPTSDFEWRLEQDCIAAAETMQALASDPTPFGASEVIRRLLTTPSFFGTNGRIARLYSLPSIRLGFGCIWATLGISRSLGLDPEATTQAATDQEEFFAVFLQAIAESAEHTYEAAAKLQRLSTEMVDLCQPERSTSSISLAVRSILVNPLTTQRRLAQDVGCSTRGASDLIGRMIASGCLHPLEGSPVKNRAYICRKAISV